MEHEMQHFFNVRIATEYGTNCAIILNNIYYWTIENEANNRNFYDGRYWTYNSIRAYKEIFPYMSEKTIRNSINKLIEEGILIDGNYNDIAYDRTKWYAITDKGFSILQNEKIHSPEKANGIIQKGEPIPLENHIENTDNIIDSKESICQTGNSVRQAVKAWNTLEQYGIAPVKKMSSDSKRYKMLNARIKQYGLDDVLKTIESVKQSDFLLGRVTGRAGRPFVLTLDWFVLPNNYPKISEGFYLNKGVKVLKEPQIEYDELENYQ